MSSYLPKFKVDTSMMATTAFMMLMVLIMMAAFYLLKNQVKKVHETSIGLLMGAVLSLFLSLFIAPKDMEQFLGFNENFFFVILLPPIIFNSGYSMQQRYFFANISAVGLYSFVGTLISFFVTAAIMIILGAIEMHNWSNLECFLFASLICATDPVATLAIMEASPVSRDLFSIVMGESVFNDAVAIVLHSTCLQFLKNDVSNESFTAAVVYFLVVFIGSTAVGVICGLAASLFLKQFDIRPWPHLEFVCILMFAYMSYFITAGFALSGICAILFCGVTMSHYLRPNLSEEALHVTQNAFHPFAYMCETFVFLSLGFSVFSFRHEFSFGLMLASIFAIVIARAAFIFPLGAVLNRFRSREYQLTKQELSFLWFAGLRGALAFALSLNVPTAHGHSVRTSTLIICVLSIVVLGGSTHSVLEKLNLLKPKQVMPVEGSTEAAPVGIADEDQGGDIFIRTQSGNDLFARTQTQVQKQLRRILVGDGRGLGVGVKLESAFNRFDREFIKPWFIRQEAMEEHAVETPILPSAIDSDWTSLARGFQDLRVLDDGTIMMPDTTPQGFTSRTDSVVEARTSSINLRLATH